MGERPSFSFVRHIQLVHYLDLHEDQKRLPEIGRLHNFIVNNIQTKNQNQLWGALVLLGIGALALSANQDQEDEDY